MLDEILARVNGLPPDQLEAAKQRYLKERPVWVPNPGPQTQAYLSKADVLLFGGEPGGGKLLKLDTPIPTPHGWSTIGELRVDDQVFDEQGNVCTVVAKSAIEQEPTYRLTFSDGCQIVCGARHQWVTGTRAERMRELKCNDEWRAARRATRAKRGTGKRPDLAALNAARMPPESKPTRGVRTTQDIYESLILNGGRVNHAIDLAGPLRLPEAELLIEPYVLGAWLGDGGSRAGQITGLDEEVFLQIANGGYTVTRHASPKSRGILGLQGKLKQLGVFGNKHVPVAYLRASFDQRLALLQGLMDTDGYCDTRGQCEILLTRKVLIDGVQELLLSLGIKVQMRDGEARLNGRYIGQKWRLKFLTDLPAFRLPRKLLRQKRAGFRGTHAVRYIVACERIEPVDLQCIQVDSPSHCYLCGPSMIPTHNSQLLLGLAFNEHERSLIMRRQYGDLDRLVEDALKIHGSRDGFNGSPPPKLKVSDTQIIDFAAAHRVGDEQGQMGKGRDLIGIDEATHFAEQQIRFLMGWNRTENKTQRCRVVLATNPPLTAEGLWVIKMFAPWLDPQYPNPAKIGELRWVVTDDEGADRWVPGPGQYEVIVAGNPKMVDAMSRTYIHSSVKDNPYYVASGYERQLDAMPEPYRSLLLGGFKTAFVDAPNQVIPTEWVRLAMRRRGPRPPGVPMCAMGVDPSGGGADPMAISARYDGWFADIVEVPGKDIPTEAAGSTAAGIVLAHRRDKAQIVIDMGGGFGGPMYEHFKVNGIDPTPHKGSEASVRRTKDAQLPFFNKRSELIWKFREALDPDQDGGSPMQLPDDSILLADLTAPTLDMHFKGIKVESKEDIVKRLGRSTNRGDAVVMCWSAGPTYITEGEEWRSVAKMAQPNRRPGKVIRGRH